MRREADMSRIGKNKKEILRSKGLAFSFFKSLFQSAVFSAAGITML